MAISLVAHTLTQTSTTSALDTTGATLLVLCMGYYGGSGGSVAPTDSKGNTWVSLGDQGVAAVPGAGAVYYAINPIVGTGHTFTNTSSQATIAIMAFNGIPTTSPFDQTNGNFTGGVSAQPGSITPTANGELIILGGGYTPGTNFSINSGFTTVDNAPAVFGVNQGGFSAYFVQTTAAGINPTVTSTDSNNGISVTIASFKSSGGGATRGLYLPTPMNGLGAGGSFFPDRLA